MLLMPTRYEVYFTIRTFSLHLTTMCLQYKPTVVACFCIHLACKWSNWEIPQSNEGKHWFWYIDKTVTSELLQKLTAEFLHIFDKCPSRLKRKIKSINDNQSPNMSHQITNSPFELEPRKIQSPATDGPTFPSNRSHHPQKHDDKKPTMPGRSSVDYREYREKKERERLEREKAAANAAGGSSSTGQNVTDPNKHHSHHHKQQIPGSIMPNKQAPTPNQKSALHHNHHHRPDMKLNPSLSQRHTSSTSQTRDPNRDPNRQRVATREFNSGTSGTLYHHNISQNETNLIASQPDLAARLESGLPQESASHSNPQDKLSNNNHNVHRVSSHDKRYDPRHNKLPEHRKDEQKVASYPEYRDMSRVDRQRKPDSLEQRSEEVRKLIEKPLPPPKTRQELTKDDYIAHMLKQSHHSKHNQSDKLLQGNSGQNLTIPITPQMQQQQQQQQQQKTMPKPMGHQHSMSGMQQFIKNGSSSQSSSSMSNVEDPKAEKRPRHDEKTMIEQQNVANVKPKSLFSPEKIQRDAPRDSHQRSKSRQKTPPAAKIAKQQSAALDLPATLISPFSSPPGLQQQPQQQQQQQHDSLKRPQLEIANSSHKRHRGMNEFDQTTSAQDALSSVLNATNNIPGLLQPINELPSRSSFMNDTKMPELLRPFEPESTLTHRASLGPLTNGIESRLSRQEFSEAQEFPKAQEFKVNQDFKPIIDQVNFKATQDYKLNQELKVTQDFKSAQDYKQLQDFKSVPDFKINQEYKHEVPKVHDFPKNIFDFKDGMEFPRATVQLQRLTDYPKVKVEQPKTIPECSKNQSDFVKQELQEFLVTQDPIVFPKQEPQEFIEPIVESKKKIKAEPLEEFSRTKSAQSISALLQEPLAPMPSLLQQFNQPPQHQQQIQEYPPILSAILPSEQSIQHETQQQQPQQQQQHQQPPPLVSTVDMGALSGSTIDSTLSTLSTTSTVPIMPVVVEEKKSEHHKSEKKKKEKKHKHKDKEKSKEKHKHKHKDKDKEKHRDKDRKKAEGDNMTAEPIKITIPKDKINLTSESLGSVDKLKSPPGKIKIKIAKERIKVTQSIQQQPPQPATIQPLKIKIRTDAISRGEHDTRKRERSDGHENLQSGPPNKKQQQLLLQQQQQQQQQQSVNPVLVQQQQQQQQQRSNERQNGRHYNSGSNNKEKHSSSHHKSSHKLSQQSS
ncbi:cyclin-T-like isoform X2 [Leptopilina heterotoma]|uniref:cyclin-T-like isoform X2 n=1 Tax=Leptopilina heterotoma TaxID=63436 RepID=UPI001CA9920B|nr:cyclin-T-like isoform X2 [Leptopilina heterotoma]